jgi:hypothetical protein
MSFFARASQRRITSRARYGQNVSVVRVVDQRLKRRSAGPAQDVGCDAAELDARIFKRLVQTLRFACR